MVVVVLVVLVVMVETSGQRVLFPTDSGTIFYRDEHVKISHRSKLFRTSRFSLVELRHYGTKERGMKKTPHSAKTCPKCACDCDDYSSSERELIAVNYIRGRGFKRSQVHETRDITNFRL